MLMMHAKDCGHDCLRTLELLYPLNGSQSWHDFRQQRYSSAAIQDPGAPPTIHW